MQHVRTRVGVALGLSLVVACGGASTVPSHVLRPEVVAAVDGTVAESVIRADQPTVVLWHTQSDSTPELFLKPLVVPVMFNSVEDGIAQRRLQPLAELTIKSHFRAQYERALHETLSEIGWLKLRRLEPRDTLAPSVNQHEARLQVTTSLVMTAKSSVLFVRSALAFYPAGAAIDSPGAEMQILYRSEEVGPYRGARAVSCWAEDGGKAYLDSVTEGISESMKMTTMALSHMAGTRYAGKAESLLVWTTGEPDGGGVSASEPDSIDGTVVEETSKRLILQVGAGELVSLPKSAIGSREAVGAVSGVSWHAPRSAASLDSARAESP